MVRPDAASNGMVTFFWGDTGNFLGRKIYGHTFLSPLKYSLLGTALDRAVCVCVYLGTSTWFPKGCHAGLGIPPGLGEGHNWLRFRGGAQGQVRPSAGSPVSRSPGEQLVCHWVGPSHGEL